MNLEFARRAIGESETCQRILAHFRANPAAADTEQGVASFWLDLPVRVVRQELEKMLLLGVVQRIGREQGVTAPVYRLAGTPAVQALLQDVA